MTVQDASATRVKITRRLLVVAAALVCIAIATYAVIRLTGHGDPDPGGRILDALQSIKTVVPEDATEVNGEDSKAHWDSCDGRDGTYGWSAISVHIIFTTTMQSDALVSRADSRMVAAGWTRGSALTSPIGPGRLWSRTLEDGTVATGQLTPGTTDNAQTITWQVAANAPAHGPQAHGC